MRFSWSVQSMVRRLPSLSATTINSPIGVATRSIRNSSMSGHPQMLFCVGVPRAPGLRHLGVECDRDITVPVAGRAQAGPLGDQRRELGIARQMLVDGD